MERAFAKIEIDSEIFSRNLIRQKAAAPTQSKPVYRCNFFEGGSFFWGALIDRSQSRIALRTILIFQPNSSTMLAAIRQLFSYESRDGVALGAVPCAHQIDQTPDRPALEHNL